MTVAGSSVRVAVSPEPTAEEAAAIMAAYEVLWPKPVAPARTQPTTPAWRFSGRWWVAPVPLRRARP